MIYKRHASIEVPDHEYEITYGGPNTAKRRFYNIGAGTWSHPYWTNIDLPAQTAAFAAIQAPCIHHDLMTQAELPIASDSVEAIYCSHVVEHLTEGAVLYLMKEALRCLNRGGMFRIVTGPAADQDWDALMRGDWNWWFWMNDSDFKESIEKKKPMTIYDRWLYHLATARSGYSSTPCDKKCDARELQILVEAHKANPSKLWDLLTKTLKFNRESPGDHLSWWTFDKLQSFLREAGFAKIRRSAYGQSNSVWMRDLRYFDQTYPQISVYAEATK